MALGASPVKGGGAQGLMSITGAMMLSMPMAPSCAASAALSPCGRVSQIFFALDIDEQRIARTGTQGFAKRNAKGGGVCRVAAFFRIVADFSIQRQHFTA